MTEGSGKDGTGPPIRLFAYAPSRSTQTAMTLYAGIARGAVLMTDGYEPYDAVAEKHLECLGNTHELTRNLVKPRVDEARQNFQSAISEYREFSSASALGLAAFPSPSADSSSIVSVFLDWDDVRVRL